MFQEEIERIKKSSNQAYELTKYINDDVFLEEFIEYTKPAFLIAKYDSNLDSETERKIFMAFTFIALKHYDGKLWNYVYKYYVGPNLSERDIYSKVRLNVFSGWVIGYHCDTSNREQIYQIPVIESIIPFYYAPKYIDFVFDIYEKCFQYSLENVDEELDLFFEATRELLKNDDDSKDDFKSNDTDGSSKTYKLIQGIKKIIKYNLKNKVKQLKEFTRQFLIRIDNNYFQKNKIEPNYYFDKAFEKWTLNNPEIKIKRKVGAREVYLRNRNPKFVLDTNSGDIKLYTPMLHIPKKEEPSKILIHIYENNKEIYNGIPHITNMISLMEICYQEVKIDNPLNNISCKITYNDEILYSSDEFLFRKNIFFSDDKEVKANSKFNGFIYIISKNQSSDLNLIKVMSNYLIQSFIVSEDNNFFDVDGSHYSFRGSYESELYGDICQAISLSKEDLFSLYKKINSVIMVSNNRSVFANYIKINDKIINPNSYMVKEQKNNVAYILDVDKLFKENGFYDVKLIDKSNNHIIKQYCFIIDSSISIFQNVLDDNKQKMICSFVSSYAIQNATGKIINSYENEINDFENEKFYLIIESKAYEFNFLITVPYYTVNDKVKKIFGVDVCYNEINFNLNPYIFFYNTTDKVELDYGNYSRNLLVKRRASEKYIELAEIINYKEYDKLEIAFVDLNGERQFINIYTKPVWDNLSTIYFDNINQMLQITPIIHGFDTKENIIAKLYIDDKFIADLKLNNNLETINYDLKNEKSLVEIQIGYIEKVIDYDTFEVSNKFNIIYKNKYKYIPLISLMNKALYVKYVVCYDNDDPKSISPMFLKLLSKETNNSYICEAYNDNSLSWKSKLGTLIAEFEPMYIADTNHKKRINAEISSYNQFLSNPLYLDLKKVCIDESKWCEKINYFVIEEDKEW